MLQTKLGLYLGKKLNFLISQLNHFYFSRRITKDNVKTYSRQIAKMTHNNPIIILTVVSDADNHFDSSN